jgi:TorA maturation chaperone TorD
MTEIAPLLYSFLGTALVRSDAVALRELLAELTPEVGHGDPICERIDSMADTIPLDPEDLEREFVRLFLDPAGSRCPPWQSAYDTPPQLMGASHVRALEWYRAEGVQPKSKAEPADHAGYLLLFYSRLLEAGKEADVLARFRADHLDWITSLLRSIDDQTRLPFYRELAGFGLALLDLSPGAGPRPAQRAC